MRTLKLLFFCFLLGDHEWTSDAMEGKPLTDWHKQNPIAGFKSYTRMYCKRCGHESKLNSRL